ncbi:MAG: flagellar filament capping protein FliD [Candidatus Zixiibacteriota bacterium]
MSSTFSIEGINSGLNTAEIVDAILAYERRNITFLEQQQAEKTSIITTLKALQAKFLALHTSLTKLSRSSTFDAATVQVSDESILSATVSGRVGTGSYDIQVLSLARNHQLASQGFDDESLASFGTGTISISLGDGSTQTITIDATNNSLVGIKKAINDAKASVTATIINDGSSSKPYRLMITSEKTGVANKINITSNLTGGYNLDFSSSSFDSPELIDIASATTSQITLGATASYTGSENKIYTFTVAGTGTQTVGTDSITINWSDGTNSGSIVVSQADTEIELTGAGADGLKLSFSAGTLTAGDTFQVSTFAPVLQEASDARISLGSSSGGGSPIIVTSDTNRFSNLIGGLSITVFKETGAGQSVAISTETDINSIKNAINDFITRFNEVNDYIDEQNTYDAESDEVGVLFGDFTLQMMQNSLRGLLASKIDGLEGQYNNLYAIGIRTNASGSLAIVNNSRFEEALKNNLDDVMKLFINAGTSSSNFIEFISSTSETRAGENYEVDITQAATRGRFQGSGIADPATTPLTLDSSNNRLKLIVDGLASNEIILSEKTYTSADELVAEIQSKIDNDDNIGNRGLTVQWVGSGTGSGYLLLESSVYGSTSQVQIVTTIANSAYTALGLANGTSLAGQNVAGTINGESADGKGQYLTGKEGNETTAGLKLRITLEPSQVISGSEGTITVSKGVAARLADLIDSFTKAGEGLFDRKIGSYQRQIDALQERIADYEERLELKRESLYKKFYEMEVALGELNVQSQFLTNQISGINNNWLFWKAANS